MGCQRFREQSWERVPHVLRRSRDRGVVAQPAEDFPGECSGAPGEIQEAAGNRELHEAAVKAVSKKHMTASTGERLMDTTCSRRPTPKSPMGHAHTLSKCWIPC